MKLDNPRPSNCDLTNWTWLQTAISDLRRKCTWLIPHIVGWDPIFYAHTKLSEDILISGREMHPKQNSKNSLGSGILFPVPVFHICCHSGICICNLAAMWRSPSSTFEEGICGPFHTLRYLIFYERTKFGEDSLIGSRDMPQQQNSQKCPTAAEFYFQ